MTRVLLAVFFVIVVGYGLYEAQGILFGPSIDISGRAMLVYEPYIRIQGTAQRIASLQMNCQQIPVTETGSFDQPYVLSPGYNRIVLDAKDKYGKMAERVIEIVYVASSTTATSSVEMTATSSTSTIAR